MMVAGTCASMSSAGRFNPQETRGKTTFKTGNSPLPFVDPSGRILYIKDVNSSDVTPYRIEEGW